MIIITAKQKYRIVRDRHAGFEVQTKKWWFPFWYQLNGSNTHCTIEEAKVYLNQFMNPVVEIYVKDEQPD